MAACFRVIAKGIGFAVLNFNRAVSVKKDVP
jgi:hypothetical protein